MSNSLAGRLPGAGGIVLGGIDSAIRIIALKDGRSCGGSAVVVDLSILYTKRRKVDLSKIGRN